MKWSLPVLFVVIMIVLLIRPTGRSASRKRRGSDGDRGAGDAEVDRQVDGRRSRSRFAVGALLVAAAALPLLWRNDYVIDVALTALIWMVLNQSWNLQLGIGGIWNFGQLAIFAIGGYVAGARQPALGYPPGSR